MTASHSSLNTTDDLIPNKRDGAECTCRVSTLVKAFIFLGIILAATVGLIIFFLNNNNRELLKDNISEVTTTNLNHISPSNVASSIDTSENFIANDGEVSNTVTSGKPKLPIKSSKTSDNTRTGSHHDVNTNTTDNVQAEFEKVWHGFDDDDFKFDVDSVAGVKNVTEIYDDAVTETTTLTLEPEPAEDEKNAETTPESQTIQGKIILKVTIYLKCVKNSIGVPVLLVDCGV